MPDQPPNPESRVDHFKIWQIAEREFSHAVTLKGQFDPKGAHPRREQVQRLAWVANPTRKDHHQILRPRDHLLGYYLHPPAQRTPRWVQVTNQFQSKVIWRLAEPVILLVPASKVFEGQPPAPPRDLDHYECYLVIEPAPVNRTVTLQDQFDQRRHAVEKIARLVPAFFGVPVSKNGERILHPDIHLTLYNLSPSPTLRKPIGFMARDQFRVWESVARKSVMLGVPSEKLRWGQGEPPKP